MTPTVASSTGPREGLFAEGGHPTPFLNDRSSIARLVIVGRTRGFDEATVLRAAVAAFRASGYEGTSVGELVEATGLHRGSLYQAFGSKRGLFLAGLRQVLHDDPAGAGATDLLLVSLVELAPRDDEVRSLLHRHLADHGLTTHDLGARLLRRARIDLQED
jgi:AcrR family transcriptional regulator